MSNIKIALDAGHGPDTAGKRCMKEIDPNETREYTLNKRVCDLVQAKLVALGVSIIRVDDGKTDVSLVSRYTAANKGNADYYISVHHNAGIKGKDGGGVVVLHFPTSARQADAADLYNAVVAKNGLVGNRSQKCAPRNDLAVLTKTNMGALLLENGFMDSTTDVPIILSDAHAVKTADGIVDFIRNKFALGSNPVEQVIETVCPHCGKVIK